MGPMNQNVTFHKITGHQILPAREDEDGDEVEEEEGKFIHYVMENGRVRYQPILYREVGGMRMPTAFAPVATTSAPDLPGTTKPRAGAGGMGEKKKRNTNPPSSSSSIHMKKSALSIHTEEKKRTLLEVSSDAGGGEGENGDDGMEVEEEEEVTSITSIPPLPHTLKRVENTDKRQKTTHHPTPSPMKEKTPELVL